jgi:hypothetical protein
MASADFCGRIAHVALTLHVPCPHHHRYCRLEDRTQTSPVNGNNFHPMWPLNLPVALTVGLRHILQTHPVNRPCIQFLFVGSGLCRRLPSHNHSHDCTCLKLVVLPLGSTAPTVDFHHLVIAHAGQTREEGRQWQPPSSPLSIRQGNHPRHRWQSRSRHSPFHPRAPRHAAPAGCSNRMRYHGCRWS